MKNGDNVEVVKILDRKGRDLSKWKHLKSRGEIEATITTPTDKSRGVEYRVCFQEGTKTLPYIAQNFWPGELEVIK